MPPVDKHQDPRRPVSSPPSGRVASPSSGKDQSEEAVAAEMLRSAAVIFPDALGEIIALEIARRR